MENQIDMQKERNFSYLKKMMDLLYHFIRDWYTKSTATKNFKAIKPILL